MDGWTTAELQACIIIQQCLTPKEANKRYKKVAMHKAMEIIRVLKNKRLQIIQLNAPLKNPPKLKKEPK